MSNYIITIKQVKNKFKVTNKQLFIVAFLLRKKCLKVSLLFSGCVTIFMSFCTYITLKETAKNLQIIFIFVKTKSAEKPLFVELFVM